MPTADPPKFGDRAAAREKISNLDNAGWLEGVHINGNMALKYPDLEVLSERLGEQKLVLESILLLLGFYAETDANIKMLYEEMINLQSVFEKVQITYTREKPTTKIVDGILMVQDNSTSTVHITKENVEEIQKIVSEIRNKILG